MATYPPSLPKTYKRIQWTTPGNPSEILSLNDSAPLPTVERSNILARIHAAAINPCDWRHMRGYATPFMPKVTTPGCDIAGTVVAIGPKASGSFQLGDKIMAMFSPFKPGGLAEYAIVEESMLAKKPERWSFEQAAAWPLATNTIWQALVVEGRIKSGDKVLVVGASGGTGSVAVQLAKAFGAYVVGVCSTANVQLVKNLGADEVVDYKITDITAKYTDQDFHIVLDTVGPAKEIWANRETILKPTGRLVRIAVSDDATDTLFTMIGEFIKIYYTKLLTALKRGPGYHLAVLPLGLKGSKLAEAIWMLNEVANADPVIDSVNEFTLPAVIAAFKKSQSGRAKGKIVIKIV